MNTKAPRIAVGLVMGGEDAKPHYYLLEEDKDTIEGEIGTSLEWMELPGKKESRVLLRWHGADPTNRRQWPEQHRWLCEKLEAFYTVFGPRVKGLDAGDYLGEDEVGEVG